MALRSSKEIEFDYKSEIKNYLDHNKLSQGDLAKSLNISRERISKSMNGKKYPSFEDRVKLLKFFGKI